jgi:L-fucose isomerase-like protein
MTFALFFGNRGFFPGELIAGARNELKTEVEQLGFDTLIMNEDATRFGAVETIEEGGKYAAFLKENAGKFDGVILSLPNFGDENGAIAALQDCGVPILIQAYPDKIGEMDFANRRDSFCGKFSIMDVFYQYGLPFTVFTPHVVHPDSDDFRRQMSDFAAVCRVVKKMKRFSVGAIGARTTAFKTVRFDEITLQKYGITTESLDLSELMMRVKDIRSGMEKFELKRRRLLDYTNWQGVPEERIDMLAKVGVALDDIVNEFQLDAIALRCWVELEKELHIAPCVLLGEMNDRGIAAACELDVCNAVPMRALQAASNQAATVLDWNNNYGDEPDKCILFHCGPVPQSLMNGKGHIEEHKMFVKSIGPDCSWGCNIGRIKDSPMTFASSKTEDGKLKFYLGEGRFTADPVEEEFFGCAGVVEIADLQNKLLKIGKNGYRHHVGLTFGHVEVPVREAFTTYLGYDILDL